MPSKYLYLIESRSASCNLSLEEYFLEHSSSADSVLLLYINEPCVVMGKNQNPWWETNPEQLRQHDIPLLRRVSGGGTVFHDCGNLNYSFIQPRSGFNKDHNLELLAAFFRQYYPGISRTEMGDLLVDGAKFSGNALCHKKTHSLHHGTLLFESNLSLLKSVLEPPQCRNLVGHTRQVFSRPMKTANLKPYLPFAGIQEFTGAVCAYLSAQTGAVIRSIDASRIHDYPLDAYVARHENSTWVFGHTPEFSLEIPGGTTARVQAGDIVAVGKKEKEWILPQAVPFPGLSDQVLLETMLSRLLDSLSGEQNEHM